MDGMAGLDVTTCTRCPELVASRSRIVNGAGADDTPILLVGEAPGAEEDREGKPFVGRSGEVLEAVLRDLGYARRDVRITNCVRCRPPDNRDPSVAELENCRGYLEAEIGILDPAVIVALGKVPSEHLLGRTVAVTGEAGTIETAEIGGVPRDVVVCVHPAATLYDPSQRDTLEGALRRAFDRADAGSGQSQLGEY